MKKNSMIRKAANSFAGRLLRRILGEEKGQAMMEYIVICLLIAALAVIGVAAFGHTAVDMFASLGHTITGFVSDADNTQKDADNNLGKMHDDAQAYANGKHNGSPTGNKEYGKD